ncbi:hypothetical protein [Sedimentibacter sp.]|uniref:hypothetical protein n=1 Tax=Sedimentibacter sp. TaxID=1960295 RepID=UPI0028AC8680|nr:hypothetical protein [Sedimentibacter sp.]
MMKKRICLLLLSLLLVIGALPISAYANDMEKDLNAPEKILEDSDALVTINQELGLVIISTRVCDNSNAPYHEEIDLVNVDFQDNIGPYGYPEKPTSATFSHKIYDRNGILMATAYVTVKGWYSEVDQWSEVESITADFEGEYASRFSYTTSRSGETGTIKLYFNGAYAGGFLYTIHYNGRITSSSL